MTGHGGNVFGKDSARPRTLPFRLNVPGPGAYPSHARNQPGPGAYPGFMQAQMMPTQFEFYPEARHEQDTRVQTAARELTAMAMATQARVDADNRAKADALAKYRGMVAAAHAPPKPSTPARPHTVAIGPGPLGLGAGVNAARYPTVPSVLRPRWQGRSAPSVSPSEFTTDLMQMLLSRRTNVATGAESRALNLLHTLHAIARQSSTLPAVPVHTPEQRMPSSERGLSLSALRALRRFYAQQELEGVTLRELRWGGGSAHPCALTRHTGLSVAETLVLQAESAEAVISPIGQVPRKCIVASSVGYGVAVQSERVIGVAQLVAPVTTYVDCTAASDATPLIDVLDAITKLVAEEEEEAERMEATFVPAERYVWLEVFATSPTMLTGAFMPQRFEPAARAVRTEDLEAAVEEARTAAREVFVYEGAGRCRVASPSSLGVTKSLDGADTFGNSAGYSAGSEMLQSMPEHSAYMY